MEADQVWFFSKHDHEQIIVVAFGYVDRFRYSTRDKFQLRRKNGNGGLDPGSCLVSPPREDRKQRLPQTPFPIKIEQRDRDKKIFLNQSGNI